MKWMGLVVIGEIELVFVEKDNLFVLLDLNLKYSILCNLT